MQSVSGSYERKYEVSDSVCDFKRHLKISSVLQFFQDVATVHAAQLNCSYDAMRERGYFWVLSRVAFEVLEEPEIGSEVTVRTFPERPLPIQCHRCYDVTDGQGRRLINGYSMWCILDVGRNRITPVKNIGLSDPVEYLTKDFEISLDKILMNGAGERVYVKKVRVSDLDANIHMNNTRYAEVLEDAFAFEELKECEFKRVQINFLAQSREGEEIHVYRQQIGNGEYLVEGRLEDKTPCFSAKISLA